MPAKKPTTKKGKQAKVQTVLHEFKAGTLHSGSSTGPKVKSRKQAVAIALSESGQSKPKRTRQAKAKRRGGATVLMPSN
jgi:hypothetical protein